MKSMEMNNKSEYGVSGRLNSQNLNVAATEELKGTRGKQADELSGSNETARWMDIRVSESTEEIVLRIHYETM